jgi:AhpD family alkylhydroperoxidase
MSEDHERQRPEPRIRPLPEEEWSPEAREALSVLPVAMRPPPGQQINSLSVFALHPDLARADLGMSLYLRFSSTIDARASELLILRTAWLNGADYELLRHARKARREGWSDEEIARVAEGSTAPGWEPGEALLLRVAEEIHREACVSEPTWAALAERYSDQQLLDILYTVGTYVMHAIVFNSIGLEPEGDLPPFPGSS